LGLLSHIGIPVDALGLSEVKVLSNLDKIRLISIPTLIIHAEEDFIVPIENGRALYEGSTAKEKRLFTIPNADHNSIMLIGGDSYFKAIGEFVSLHS
jgi:pimeloyl-ACP methyl ester carboxylesterase